MNKNINVPIGLDPVVAAVNDICNESAVYHHCGVMPSHFLINLDKGNGQTTVTSYVADVYQEYGVRQFKGMDMYLEYILDGSMDQIDKIFKYLHQSAGVYTNEYEGVISMDISALAAPNNAAQMAFFLKEIASIAEYATIILYVPSAINSNMSNFIDKIRKVLRSMKVIKVEAYTAQNLVDIIKNMIEDAGVDLTDDVDDSILNVIHTTGASNIKDAKLLTQNMVKNANFSHFVPELNADRINTAFGISNAKKEGK